LVGAKTNPRGDHGNVPTHLARPSVILFQSVSVPHGLLTRKQKPKFCVNIFQCSRRRRFVSFQIKRSTVKVIGVKNLSRMVHFSRNRGLRPLTCSLCVTSTAAAR